MILCLPRHNFQLKYLLNPTKNSSLSRVLKIWTSLLVQKCIKVYILDVSESLYLFPGNSSNCWKSKGNCDLNWEQHSNRQNQVREFPSLISGQKRHFKPPHWDFIIHLCTAITNKPIERYICKLKPGSGLILLTLTIFLSCLCCTRFLSNLRVENLQRHIQPQNFAQHYASCCAAKITYQHRFDHSLCLLVASIMVFQSKNLSVRGRHRQQAFTRTTVLI